MNTIEDILSTLVSFRTVSEDKQENKKAIDWIEKQLPSSLFVTRHESDGFSSLVATTNKTKSPKVWLAGHVDVVSGSDALFTMRTDEQRLFGRGVFDMKFALALYITLLQEKKDILSEYDLGLMVTSDEELIGQNGVKYLMDQGYGGTIVFLPDGGEDWKMQSTAKGCVRIKVSARGKSAHGSRPWEGSNAIHALMHFLRDVELLFDETKHDTTRHHNTMNIGKIQGGEAINQVADYAEAYIDIRYIPETPWEGILKNIQEIGARHSTVTIDVFAHLSAHQTDLSAPEVVAWQDIAQKQYAIKTEPIHAHGGSDANYFAEKNMNVILVRPEGGDQHAEHEWIDRDGLKKFYQVLSQWIDTVARRDIS